MINSSRSLVNENSDTWVVKQLGEELTPEFRRLMKEEQLGWTQTVNRQMRSLWEKGVSKRARCCTSTHAPAGSRGNVEWNTACVLAHQRFQTMFTYES